MSDSVRGVLTNSLNSTWVEYEFQRALCCRKLKRGRVHDFRTAIRRIGAILDLICRLDPSDGAPDRLKRSIHRELKAVRELRDLQVQEERVVQDLRLRDLCRRIARRKRKARRRAWRCLTRRRIEKSRRRLFRVERELCGLTLSEHSVSRALGGLHREMKDAAARMDPRDLSTIHRVRVLFRRYRYSCEAMGYLDADSERACAEFQGLLGELQDLVVLKGMLKKREAAFAAEVDRETGAKVGEILRRCGRVLDALS